MSSASATLCRRHRPRLPLINLRRGFSWLVFVIVTMIMALAMDTQSTIPPSPSPNCVANDNDTAMTILLVACDRADVPGSRASPSINVLDYQLEFSRQVDQILVFLKSLLIAWHHDKHGEKRSRPTTPTWPWPTSLNVVILTKNVTKVNHAIQEEVTNWGQGSAYTVPLNIIVEHAEYPDEFRWMEPVFAPCSSLRLFAPELAPLQLRCLDRVLYLDTDFIFLRDVRHLWTLGRAYEEENQSALFFATQDGARSWFGTPNWTHSFNSGLLYMNLRRWRETFYNDWLNWLRTRRLEGPPGSKKAVLRQLHDQALLNRFAYSIYKSAGVSLVRQLPCAWNYQLTYFYNRRSPTLNTCSQRRVFALHGTGGSFHRPTLHNRPITTVFDYYKQTTLGPNFCVPEFKRGLHYYFRLNKWTQKGNPSQVQRSAEAKIMKSVRHLC